MNLFVIFITRIANLARIERKRSIHNMKFKYLIIVLASFLGAQTYSATVMVNIIVGSQATNTRIDLERIKGRMRTPHISLLKFRDNGGYVGKNLGEFLISLQESGEAIQGLTPFFKAQELIAFQSKATHQTYFTLQPTPATKEAFKSLESIIKKSTTEFILKQAGLRLPLSGSLPPKMQPPLQEAGAMKTHDLDPEFLELSGLPHISVSKIKPLDALAEELSQSTFKIIGFQVIYFFEKVGEDFIHPQIFIEKWFDDPTYHISTRNFNLLKYKNHAPIKVDRSTGTHYGAFPEITKLSISDMAYQEYQDYLLRQSRVASGSAQKEYRRSRSRSRSPLRERSRSPKRRSISPPRKALTDKYNRDSYRDRRVDQY